MLRVISRPSKQNGFTLLEVLIAVIILALGMLGLAKLQATGLSYNHSAYMRTQATLMAYDIIDRMYANRGLVFDGCYDVGIEINDYGSCTDAMSSDDLEIWKGNIEETLVQGKGSIDATPDGENLVVTVNISWDASRTQTEEERVETEGRQTFEVVTGL